MVTFLSFLVVDCRPHYLSKLLIYHVYEVQFLINFAPIRYFCVGAKFIENCTSYLLVFVLALAIFLCLNMA